MVRAIGRSCFLWLPMIALLTVSAAAEAACRDGVEASLPNKVTFDNGSIVEVLERDANGLRYRATDGKSGRATESRVQAGTFVLETLLDGKAITFDWSTPLPSLTDLVVGASFDADATVTAPDRPSRSLRVIVKVQGEDVVLLDGCRYPVLIIEVRNFDSDQQFSTVTKYLHVASQIPLRTIVREGDKVVENRVIGLN